jgi:DNA-binding transcriptional LysR family regulator
MWRCAYARRMELRHLKHFLAIAKAGSLTDAAQVLGLAQPALSQSLTRLEKDLGERLFVRSRHGAKLTEAGKAFLDDVVEGVSLIDAAAARTRQTANGQAGRLVIGFVTSALQTTLPNALRRLRAEHPAISIVLREMNNLEQVDALRRKEIDIGFAHSPLPPVARVRSRFIRKESLIAALPDDFELAADGRVSIAELAAHPLITYPEYQVPLMRAGIAQAYRDAGFDLRIGIEVNRSITVLSCVVAGFGIGLIPDSVSSIRYDGVRYAALRDEAALPGFTLCAITRSSSRVEAAERLLEILAPAG